MRRSLLVATVLAISALSSESIARAQRAATFDYHVIATTKTGTMEKELNDNARAGFRFMYVMGGETAFGGKEVVAVMTRDGSDTRYEYKLLATNRTGTMQKELQQASDEGYEFRGQTVFESTFGGKEVSCILERDPRSRGASSWEYFLVATSKTGTFDKELNQQGAKGFELLGMTVGKTAMGGSELVAIMRRHR